MKLITKFFCLFTVYFLFAGQAVLGQASSLKKRIAVFVFEDKTDRSWRWWNNKGVGEGISDMLTTELVKSGEYIVIERQELDVVLKEQELGLTGAINPQTAAQVGQILGVELAVVGSVTEFGYTSSSTGGRIKGIGVGVSKQSAVVGVDCRLVNTTTGEIITAENVRKEEDTKGLKFNTRQLSFNDKKDFDESIVGKASRSAIEDMVSMVANSMPNIPWQAKVVIFQNGSVVINAGQAHGIQVGDSFSIYKKGQELIDPDTGLSLGSEDTKIGEIEITDVNVGGMGKAARGKVKSGTGFERGQIVRKD